MDSDLIDSLADALFVGRVEMRASVEEIAELVDVDPVVIRGFESGKLLPTPTVLLSLAGVLALDLGGLADRAYEWDL